MPSIILSTRDSAVNNNRKTSLCFSRVCIPVNEDGQHINKENEAIVGGNHCHGGKLARKGMFSIR